jgi:hypothetical protein
VGDYLSSANLSSHGFLFSAGIYKTIDFPGSNETYVNGINNVGEIVGYYLDSRNAFHGFVLDGGIFTSIDGPGGDYTDILGINNAGQIVGFYYDLNRLDYYAFLATPVPEPSALLLLGIGTLGMIGWAALRTT